MLDTFSFDFSIWILLVLKEVIRCATNYANHGDMYSVVMTEGLIQWNSLAVMIKVFYYGRGKRIFISRTVDSIRHVSRSASRFLAKDSVDNTERVLMVWSGVSRGVSRMLRKFEEVELKEEVCDKCTERLRVSFWVFRGHRKSMSWWRSVDGVFWTLLEDQSRPDFL